MAALNILSALRQTPVDTVRLQISTSHGVLGNSQLVLVLTAPTHEGIARLS